MRNSKYPFWYVAGWFFVVSGFCSCSALLTGFFLYERDDFAFVTHLADHPDSFLTNVVMFTVSVLLPAGLTFLIIRRGGKPYGA